MSGIFISYRREDSAGWTGRLAEQLKERFGAESIFMDIDTLTPGVDFTEALQKYVSSCNVLLAVIGPSWATATDKTGKLRLENPNDWVRVEVAAALKRKIQVIPVLVGGASVPTMDILPDELDPLAHRHAHELTDKRWHFDLEQLIKALPPIPRPRSLSHMKELWQSKPVVIGGLVIAMLVSARLVLPSGNSSHLPQPSPKPAPVVRPNPVFHHNQLRIGQPARFKDARTSWMYTVLAVHTDRSWKDALALRVTVRATNEGALQAGFGDYNFKLLVDDVPRSPTSNLNESVEPYSAKEGTILFQVPVTAQRLVLQIHVGNDIAEILVDAGNDTPLPMPTLSPTQTAHLAKVKFPIQLRVGQEARLKDHRATCVYKVQVAHLTLARPDTLSLTVTVQVTSEGPLKTDLGKNNFRLLIDDVPRPPTSVLDDSVDPHSVKEGTVTFSVPVTVKQVVLQLRMEDQAAEFPLDLSPLWG